MQQQAANLAVTNDDNAYAYCTASTVCRTGHYTIVTMRALLRVRYGPPPWWQSAWRADTKG